MEMQLERYCLSFLTPWEVVTVTIKLCIAALLPGCINSFFYNQQDLRLIISVICDPPRENREKGNSTLTMH